MTSPYARPDLPALQELERVLRHLTDELAGWRRRCLRAESELGNLKAQDGMVPGQQVVGMQAKSLDLQRENLELRARVDRAREMVVSLQQRLAFLEQEYGSEVRS